MYDITTNPEAWTPTGEILEIPNPWKHFWDWRQPALIKVAVFEKQDTDGEVYRMGFYRDKRHVLGFSIDE